MVLMQPRDRFCGRRTKVSPMTALYIYFSTLLATCPSQNKWRMACLLLTIYRSRVILWLVCSQESFRVTAPYTLLTSSSICSFSEYTWKKVSFCRPSSGLPDRGSSCGASAARTFQYVAYKARPITATLTDSEQFLTSSRDFSYSGCSWRKVSPLRR
jgi:hypothetical protein